MGVLNNALFIKFQCHISIFQMFGRVDIKNLHFLIQNALYIFIHLAKGTPQAAVCIGGDSPPLSSARLPDSRLLAVKIWSN